MCAKSLQSGPTLCDPMGYSPDSSVHGILQTRILESFAMPLSEICLIQGLNPNLSCLLHWQAGAFPLASPGKPILINKDIFEPSHNDLKFMV